MRKILSLVLSIVLVALSVSLTACDRNKDKNKNDQDSAFVNQMVDKVGEPSETFEGVLCEEKFDSAKEAAEAYVYNEIVGEGKQADIRKTESKKLSKSEIADSGIPSDLIEDADSVEELEVTYAVSEASAFSMDEDSNNTVDETKTVKVYVIKFGVNWKYFTPRPVTGETVNKTYYDSVFDTEKYSNCTFTSTSKVYIDYKMSGEGETMSETMEMEMTQVVKYADNKVYLEQTATVKTTGEDLDMEDTSIYCYLEEDEAGDIICYVKENKSDPWIKGDLSAIGFASLEELRPFYDQYLDYTYFKKTDYGFELSEDNALAYFEQAFSQVAGGVLSGMLDMMDVEMVAQYVVKEGVLSAMITDATVDMDTTIEGISMKMTETVKAEMYCTDYGTTVITRPGDID